MFHIHVPATHTDQSQQLTPFFNNTKKDWLLHSMVAVTAAASRAGSAAVLLKYRHTRLEVQEH